MYWEEKPDDKSKNIPDNVLDVVFGISCRTLPVDHAYALSAAIKNELDWIDDEPCAGVHAIHVAASGNGWFRPDDASQLLHLSRRTKLTLRVPRQRINDAKALIGKTLDVGGNSLTINNMSEKKLSDIATLFSRYIVIESASNENQFMEEVFRALNELGIKPKKMLCGKETHVSVKGDLLTTRSLMIADLSSADSILLQQQGLGSHRWMGCGIFLPHKDINEVGEMMG
jgi:CRISPR-associated protein Cas6